jgi:hypothetical protein
MPWFDSGSRAPDPSVLDGIDGVRVRVSVRNAACVPVAFSVWSGFTVQTGKRSEHPIGFFSVAHNSSAARAGAKEQRNSMASSCVNSCRKRAPYTECIQIHRGPRLVHLVLQRRDGIDGDTRQRLVIRRNISSDCMCPHAGFNPNPCWLQPKQTWYAGCNPNRRGNHL